MQGLADQGIYPNNPKEDTDNLRDILSQLMIDATADNLWVGDNREIDVLDKAVADVKALCSIEAEAELKRMQEYFVSKSIAAQTAKFEIGKYIEDRLAQLKDK